MALGFGWSVKISETMPVLPVVVSLRVGLIVREPVVGARISWQLTQSSGSDSLVGSGTFRWHQEAPLAPLVASAHAHREQLN